MTPIEFNRKSWHYKVARWGQLRTNYADETDLCTYTRAFLWGLFLMAFVFAILGGLVISELAFFWQVGYWALHGTALAFHGFGGLGALINIAVSLIALAVMLIAAVAYTVEWFQMRRIRKNSSVQPGFISLAYRGWKNKFCVPIKVVRD